MPIKPEEALELVKFLNLDEAESLDQAKEKFNTSYLKSEELNNKIGRLTGSVAAVVKKAYEPFGVTLSDEDFKTQKIEDVIRGASDKAKTFFETQKSEWEKRAEGKGGEELVKQWEDKYKKVEKSLLEEKQLKADVLAQFDGFKTQVEVEKKQTKLNGIFEKSLEEIKIDPTTDKYKLKGFKSEFFEKYKIDLEEDSPIIKEIKTGEKLKSSAKAGSYMTVSDVLLKEATEAGIIQKSPHQGKPAKGNPNPQTQEPEKKIIRGLHPRFFTGV
jgi:hypothetical protein